MNAATPNVVMIVLDDLGFSDFGCYGSDIATPNVDALADEGLRYNNFHVTAVCASTRACLLTGRNHHAVGFGWLPEAPPGAPGYTCRLPRSAGTLPRLLRDAGYNAFAIGKWHLTPTAETSAAGPFERWPLGVGFERFYGFLRGATNQWTPDLVADNGPINPPRSPDEGYHLTEDLASQAIRFVQDQQQAEPGKPFFLYFATGAMHDPHHVHRHWVEPYRGRFDHGWEVERQHRFLNQRTIGVVPPKTTLTERPPWVASWDGLSTAERRVFARQMEVYAGFLTHTDAQIGRLLDFLATIGVLDDTLVMILSDNGAAADAGPFGAVSMGRLDVESAVQRLDDIGGYRSWNHYAWGWAWAGNTPLRLWKHYTWLGGVRVPLIVRWPAGITSEHHRDVRPQFCHAVDLMPTILDVAGVDAPDVLDGVAQQRFDGGSLVSTFTNRECAGPRMTQYFEMEGSRAIYDEGWKATSDHVSHSRQLIEGSTDFGTDRWSLFDLANDFSEAHDVADAHADKLCQLVELWWHEAGRNQVLPLDDREFVERMDATFVPAAPVTDDDWARARVYHAGGGPIVTPSLKAGFRITADIEVPDRDPARDVNGVICAQGDWTAGWVCYVLGGSLVVTFTAGGNPTGIVVAEPLTTGDRRIEISVDPAAGDRSQVHVLVDAIPIGDATVPWSPATLHWLSMYAPLFIGCDRGFAVDDDYSPPFPFTDRIHQVVLGLPVSAVAENAPNAIVSDSELKV